MVKKEELAKKKWKQLVKLAKEYTDPDLDLFLQQRKSIFLLKLSPELEVVYDDQIKIPLFIKIPNVQKLIPSLHLLRKYPNILPKIKTDAGATKFLLNGADLMAPGITEHDEFKKEEIVQIVNPQGNVLSVGQALFDSATMPKKGKVVKTLSYLNDEIWNIKV